MIVGRDADLAAVASRLTTPGLVVIAGPPGIGRSALAGAAARRTGRPIALGGGLSLLRDTTYLPLIRAIRAPLPEDDPALAIEAVRARVGDGVLILDDLQWADRASLRLLPRLREYLPILTCVRTPAPLLGPALTAMRELADLALDLGPLPDAAARQLVGTRPDAEAILAAGAGNPAVLTALLTATGPTPPASVPALIAELPQPERTALAALGLLGRPAPLRLLGPGGPSLLEHGLAVAAADGVSARPRLLAEVAAGVLPEEQRTAMHARLAELVPDPGEAARQYAAAGRPDQAAARAEMAAVQAAGPDARADFLTLAAEQAPTPDRRVAAARAALDAGRAETAHQLLDGLPATVPTAVLAARAELRRGDAEAARLGLDAVLAAVDSAATEVRGEYAVATVEVETVRDPAAACVLAEFSLAQLGADAPPQLSAAYGVARLAADRDGWEAPLRSALTALDGQDGQFAVAAILVECLRAQLRTAEAADLAEAMAARCAERGAYSWEVGFRAEALWGRLHTSAAADAVVRQGTALLDRALPRRARVLLGATVALVLADGGSIPAARTRLAAVPAHPLTDWVRAEIAWLDGDPEQAAELAGPLLRGPRPVRALAALTSRFSTGAGSSGPALPSPAAETVRAEDPAELADRWHPVMRREEVRCLLAGADAAEPLLRAEELADAAGLVILLGRTRRRLRRHGMTRADAPATSGSDQLSPREYQTLTLVGEGLSSRRIAERLGLSANTVETYIRSAMHKLRARTRTEAAVRAGAAGVKDPA